MTYRRVGSGPNLVLIHGITSSSRTWDAVIPALAEHYTVIAPDLLGHGRSAKPRGDYSLGAYASGIRDLLAALDVPSATIVGHSLGGGVAMQFSYQFPERVERLVLVDSGGLGREVLLALQRLRVGQAFPDTPAMIKQLDVPASTKPQNVSAESFICYPSSFGLLSPQSYNCLGSVVACDSVV